MAFAPERRVLRLYIGGRNIVGTPIGNVVVPELPGTPEPVFAQLPMISPGTGTAGVTVFTANDGIVLNATSTSQRWLLSTTAGDSAIGTGPIIASNEPGQLMREVTAFWEGEPVIALSPAVTVQAATTTPTPDPTPSKPVFNKLPSISPPAGTAGVTEFMGDLGETTGAVSFNWRWMLDGEQLGEVDPPLTKIPLVAGDLTFEVKAKGAGGETTATSVPVKVNAGGIPIPTPVMTIETPGANPPVLLFAADTYLIGDKIILRRGTNELMTDAVTDQRVLTYEDIGSGDWRFVSLSPLSRNTYFWEAYVERNSVPGQVSAVVSDEIAEVGLWTPLAFGDRLVALWSSIENNFIDVLSFEHQSERLAAVRSQGPIENNLLPDADGDVRRSTVDDPRLIRFGGYKRVLRFAGNGFPTGSQPGLVATTVYKRPTAGEYVPVYGQHPGGSSSNGTARRLLWVGSNIYASRQGVDIIAPDVPGAYYRTLVDVEGGPAALSYLRVCGQGPAGVIRGINTTGTAGTLAGYGATDNSASDIDIIDCVVVNGAVTLAEVQKLEGWMARRAGALYSLPEDHPYKEAVPTVEDVPEQPNDTLNATTVTVGDSWIAEGQPPYAGYYVGNYYYYNPEHSVLNLAKGGQGLWWFRQKVPEIIAARPYVLYYSGGRNDFINNNSGNGYTDQYVYEQYVAEKRGIIDDIKAALPGVAVVLETLTEIHPPGQDARAASYNAFRKTLNALLRQWKAEGYIYDIVEIGSDPVLGRDGGMRPENPECRNGDGLHLSEGEIPNGEGYARPIFAATMDGVYARLAAPNPQEDEVSTYRISTPTSPPATEGNSGTKTYAFPIDRIGALSKAGAVDWEAVPDGPNPVSASDFPSNVLPKGTTEFAANVSAGVASVVANGDTDVEPNKGFRVALYNPRVAGVIDSSASSAGATIVNDDQPAGGGTSTSLTAVAPQMHDFGTNTPEAHPFTVDLPAGRPLFVFKKNVNELSNVTLDGVAMLPVVRSGDISMWTGPDNLPAQNGRQVLADSVEGGFNNNQCRFYPAVMTGTSSAVPTSTAVAPFEFRNPGDVEGSAPITGALRVLFGMAEDGDIGTLYNLTVVQQDGWEFWATAGTDGVPKFRPSGDGTQGLIAAGFSA